MELMSYLKESTNERHLQIRAGALAQKIMDGELTLDEYQILILANYWFHGYLEAVITKVLSPDQLIALEYDKRAKASYAEEELIALGISPSAIPEALNPPVFEDYPEALGALYVTEGTAIGGALIRKQLLQHEIITEHALLKFYGCYGKALAPLWKSFVHFMNHQKVTAENVLNGAKKTFRFYEQCLAHADQSLTVGSNN